MSRLVLVLICAVVSSGAYAQLITLPSHYGSPSGFGNVLYPGVGHAPVTRPAGFPRSAPYPGSGFRGVVRPPAVGHPGHARQVVVPYPVFIGGYGYGYGLGYDPGAPPLYAYPPDPALAGAQPVTPPVVIINQAYKPETVSPVIHDYETNSDTQSSASGPQTYIAPAHPFPDPNEQKQGRAATAPDEKPTLYLLAFKDHTILPALAYWVEGDTLNYVTESGVLNRASLALIDKDFSKELNKQRSVEFNLP